MLDQMIKTRSTLQAVLRAMKTLESEQAKRARKNARARVFGAIRGLENAIDGEFPLIKKPKPELDQTLEAMAERMSPRGLYMAGRRHLRKIALPFDHEIAQRITCDWYDFQTRPIPLLVPIPLRHGPYGPKPTTRYARFKPKSGEIYYPILGDPADTWIALLREIIAVSIRRGATGGRGNRSFVALIRQAEKWIKEARGEAA